jgi:hypothetical protein
MTTEDTEKEKGLKPKTVIGIVAVVIVAALSAYVFYDFNGHSFDVSDREVLLIMTDSMDGDNTEYKIHSFPKNTLVMVKHLSEEEKQDIQIGDVISFHYESILIHHRVIELHMDQGYVNTQGDNRTVRELVYLSDVNGEVIGTSYWLGVLTAFVKTYFFFILAAFCVLMALWIVRDEFPRKKLPEEV